MVKLFAGANQKTIGDFVRESELMADLKHPNIVCLIGVCMQEEPKEQTNFWTPHIFNVLNFFQGDNVGVCPNS